MGDTDTTTAALDAAAQGIPIFPLHHPDHDGRCSCGDTGCTSPGKHPRTSHGVHDATTDPDTIRGWWRRWPDANIGAATGPASGILAIDIDGPDGTATLDALERLHGPLPATPNVATGRGHHLLYAWPPGLEAGNTAGRLGPGIDTRGAGGYIVWPGSHHACGVTYRWENETMTLADPPGWLVALLTKPTNGGNGTTGATPGRAWIDATLGGMTTDITHTPEGQRNTVLNAKAWRAGRLVAGGALPADRTRQALTDAAHHAGLTARETAATIESGLAAGAAHPTTPADRAAAPPAPPDLWTARPWLTHIRDAAHARLTSPVAVLHCILARTAAVLPHTIKLPPTVGTHVGLSFLAAIVAPPGVGKSSANAVAADLLAAGDLLADTDQLPLGTGEGLAEVLFGVVSEPDPDTGKTVKIKRQVRHNAFVFGDEGEMLGALGGRTGATLTSTLRSIFTDGTLGQTNASEDRRRRIPAGRYAFGVVVAFQDDAAETLLGDVGGGTPQRFAYAAATDPTIEWPAPPWPGPLELEPPRALMESHRDIVHGIVAHVMGLDPAVAAQIASDRLAVTRGTRTLDPLDAHRNLLRLKIAGLCCLHDHRFDIDNRDWTLAGRIIDLSDTTRTALTVRLAARHQSDEEHRARREGARRVISDEMADAAAHTRTIRSIADRVAAIVATEGPRSKGDLVRRFSRGRREMLDEALRYAVETGVLTVSGDDRPGTEGTIVGLKET